MIFTITDTYIRMSVNGYCELEFLICCNCQLPITILTNVEMEVIERFFNTINGLKDGFKLVFHKFIM